jgi:hypothetical protein
MQDLKGTLKERGNQKCKLFRQRRGECIFEIGDSSDARNCLVCNKLHTATTATRYALAQDGICFARSRKTPWAAK